MLTHHAAICLERNWNLLASLVLMVRQLTSNSRFTRLLQCRAYRILRAAEGLARRLLVLRALLGPLPELNPSEKVQNAKDPHPEPVEGRGSHARKIEPNLKLEEPLPKLLALLDDAPEPTEPREVTPSDPDTPASADHALARLKNLETLLLDPAPLIRRMARWIASHRGETGRWTPFGIGRPPGALKRPKDKLLDRALCDTDYFARKALYAAPG